MSDWRPEHANQLHTAYAILRSASADIAPADRLYRDWYAVRSPHAVPHSRWAAPVSGTARAAHAAASSWSEVDSEVLVTGLAGVVVVGTARGRRALCRGEYVTTQGRAGFPPRVGDRVRTLDRHGAIVQEGWWRTWSAGWDPRAVPGPLVRVYLRPAPGGVAQVVQAATSALGEVDEWLLKVAVTPDQLERPDACVVYLSGASRHRAMGVVARALAGLTVGEPPPLTHRVAVGVGWAEDPGTGESFGEVRCNAIATAYVGLRGVDVTGSQWLEVVADEFRCRGVDPAAPHRSAMRVEVSR